MGQPKTRTDAPQAFHVNFHTLHNHPVFEAPEYDARARRALRTVLNQWRIPCSA
jgi:hypothetical protein